LLCAFTIPLAGLLAWRWYGRTAAQIAMLLVALDPTYILTAVFDWGPVVLQHVLFLTMLLCLDVYRKTERTGYLAMAACAAGLGLWDKALFVFALSGTIGGLILMDYRGGWRPKPKHYLMALVFGALGAAPLLYYNVVRPGDTITSNTRLETDGNQLADKAAALWQSLDGSFLFHYIVREPHEDASGDVASTSASLPLGIGTHTAFPLLLVAGILGHLAGRQWRDPRVLRVAIMLVIGYAVMFVAAGIGVSAHHVVLLWPLPHILLGMILANMVSSRGALGRYVVAAVALTLLSEALVLNEYLWREKAYGGSKYWTDAVQPLATTLNDEPGPVYAADWGIENPVTVLTGGKTKIHYLDPNSPGLDTLAFRSARFVVHTPKNQIFPNSTAVLAALLTKLSIVVETQATVEDRHGRAIFEIWKVSGPPD
jgi:4-amino-4-deoxy-L-arabinose transferase-like glycosyltransferase